MEENRAENQTPRRQHTQHPTHQAHKKKKSGTAKTVIGTILAIGLTTCLMFSPSSWSTCTRLSI